jgi:fructose-specific phosphotransferase system component IIB
MLQLLTCMCQRLRRYDYVQSLELNAEEQAVSVSVNSNGAPGAVDTADTQAISNIHEANR